MLPSLSECSLLYDVSARPFCFLFLEETPPGRDSSWKRLFLEGTPPGRSSRQHRSAGISAKQFEGPWRHSRDSIQKPLNPNPPCLTSPLLTSALSGRETAATAPTALPPRTRAAARPPPSSLSLRPRARPAFRRALSSAALLIFFPLSLGLALIVWNSPIRAFGIPRSERLGSGRFGASESPDQGVWNPPIRARPNAPLDLHPPGRLAGAYPGHGSSSLF